MAGRWPTLRIGEVAEKVGMGPFGSSIKVSTFVPEGVPVISGQHLHAARLTETEFNYVTCEHAEKLRNSNVFRGDIVFTHAGNIGQVAIIPETSKFQRYILSQRQFYMRCDRSKVLPEFVTYYFRSPHGQHKLLANASQTGVPSIARPVSYLRTIEIPVPPLPEQRAIAHILGTLDDKLELNRRMNQTLEEIARALFTSWFVDFDPVRAKAEGRQPGGMDAETAALFSNSLIDSELGRIPYGWNVGHLRDICSTQYGFTTSAKTDPIGPKFLRVMDINKQEWIDWNSVPYCEVPEKAHQTYGLRPGDIVVARMADPGKSAIIDSEVDAIFASYLVRLTTRNLSTSHYVYRFLKSHLYKEYVDASRSGSVQANMNAKVIVGIRLVLPPAPLIDAFAEVVRSLRARTASNVVESSMLSAVRDALLPKLLSGNMRLPDISHSVQQYP